MTPQGMINVIQAHMDGKEIQATNSAGGWSDARFPRWDFIRQGYRIKPEPKTIWVNEYDNRGKYIYGSKRAAESMAGEDVSRIAVKYQEVIE